jgi:hypothetical protein
MDKKEKKKKLEAKPPANQTLASPAPLLLRT